MRFSRPSESTAEAAGAVGHAGADQAGVAALRHHRHLMGMTELEQGGDLPGIRRAEQQRRAAAPCAPLLGGMQSQLVRVDGPAAAPDPAVDLLEEAAGKPAVGTAARAAVMAPI